MLTVSLVKMTDFDARHVQIQIEDKTVLMRKEDCFLNATQILALTKKNPSERETLLQRLEQEIEVKILPATEDVTCSHVWVKFDLGHIICKHFGLEQELQLLIDHGLKLQRDDCSKPIKHVNNHPTRVGRRPVFVHGFNHTDFV